MQDNQGFIKTVKSKVSGSKSHENKQREKQKEINRNNAKRQFTGE